MGNLGVSVQCPVAPKTRVNECIVRKTFVLCIFNLSAKTICCTLRHH